MQRVLFSIFDPTFKRPSSLYEELRYRAAEQKLGNLMFIDCPFGGLAHPLVSTQMNAMNVEALLDRYWEGLARVRNEQIKPALAAGMNVVLDGCGLDALLSVMLLARTHQRAPLQKTHHARVATELRAHGITTPTYLIVSGSVEWELQQIVQTYPELLTMFEGHPTVFRNMVSLRKAFQANYFSDENDQLMPYRVDAEHGTPEQNVLDAFALITTGTYLSKAA